MRAGLFHLQESEDDVQGKNCKFQEFKLKNADGVNDALDVDFKVLFGTDGLMLNIASRIIQVKTTQRYASSTYGGYEIKKRRRSLDSDSTYINGEDSSFDCLIGKIICDTDDTKRFKILGLKQADFDDRHVVFLLQPFKDSENLANTFLRFKARLGAPVRGLIEEKQAAAWINDYFGDRCANPPGKVEGLFEDDSLKSVTTPGVSKNQERSFKDWFGPILNRNTNKKYRCFLRVDLVGFISLIKSKGYRYIDTFTQADFFILSDVLINDLISKVSKKENLSISDLNTAIESEDLFPISFKSSTKLNYISFISDGRKAPKESPGVIDVWQRKLEPLRDPNIKTYAKFWVSGITFFNDKKNYTINVRLNLYTVEDGDLDNKHFLVGVQLRSAGGTKCTAETSLKAYTQDQVTKDVVEVDSAGQGGKITSLLPSADIKKGEELVSKYFNSENGWATDKKFKISNRTDAEYKEDIQHIDFWEAEDIYAFEVGENYSRDKTFGLIGYLRGNAEGLIEGVDTTHGWSDFFFEIEPQKVLNLLKTVCRIKDPQEGLRDEDENDNSLNYYKWENRKRHQLSLNEKIKIAEARVRIAQRDLKSLL